LHEKYDTANRMHNGRPIRAALAAFKENIYHKHMNTYVHMNVLPQYYTNIYCTFYGAIEQFFKYLREFEAQFKKALAHESGAPYFF
jgi:hypothetical protein